MSGWYRAGTVSINNNSNQLVGQGTAWLDAGVAIGEAVRINGLGPFEILSVNGNTSITLGELYVGANVMAGSYVVVPTQSYERDLAATVKALVNAYASVKELAGKGFFPPGETTNGVLKPSLRGVGDEDTGLDLPGNNILRLIVGGLMGLQIAADGTPSGPAALKMPVSGPQAAAFPMWRGDVGLDQDFHALLPGMYRYTPGVDGVVHANAPPVEYGYGFVIVQPGAVDLASYIEVIPDPPWYRRWTTNRFGTNEWRPWRPDGAQIQLDNGWEANQTFKGFVQLGVGAAPSKEVEIQAVLGPVGADSPIVAHGVDPSKITGLRAMCDIGVGGRVPPGVTNADGSVTSLYSVYASATHVRCILPAGATTVAGKPITITVTCKE